MRRLLDTTATVFAVGIGLPIYLSLLPSSPALGAILLGSLLIGLPWSFRRAQHDTLDGLTVPDHPPSW